MAIKTKTIMHKSETVKITVREIKEWNGLNVTGYRCHAKATNRNDRHQIAYFNHIEALNLDNALAQAIFIQEAK
tara:strand:- start:323 stop:544 length:222 start_codon:yes stop_codon:yes gene_type:complete